MVPHAYAGDGSLHLLPCVPELGGDGRIASSSARDFNDVIQLGWNLINAAFFVVVLVMLFLLLKAGFQYLTATDDPGVIKKAKATFKKLAIGVLIMISGWLVINFIVETVVDPKIIKNPLVDE